MNPRGTLCVLALLPWTLIAHAGALQIDPSHTMVMLQWTHRGLSHPIARMEKVEGSVSLDPSDIARSSVSVSLPLAGLHTGSEFLDKRLKTAEFFDADRYPQITFHSTRVETAGANALRITGDLSVHGITRPVVLDAKINHINTPASGRREAGFDTDVELLRSDFGVSKYVPMVSDEVAVHISLEAYEE